MSLAGLDATAVARSLAQIAPLPDDVADAYFERLEVAEQLPARQRPAVTVRREEGFAVRLVRGDRVWSATEDGFEAGRFARALRRVARTVTGARYPEPVLAVPAWSATPDVSELAGFVPAVEARIHRRWVDFPLELTLRRHRRWSLVVGRRFAGEPQYESFYSCEATLPGARHGDLFTSLGGAAAERFAERLVTLFAARRAAPPQPGRYPVVLGPAAAAVCLHEAVAHAWRPTSWHAPGTRRPRSGCDSPGRGSTSSTTRPQRRTRCVAASTMKDRRSSVAGFCARGAWRSRWLTVSGPVGRSG